MKPTWRWLLLVAPLLFAFAAGCGGGDKVQMPTNSSPPAPMEKPKPSATM